MYTHFSVIKGCVFKKKKYLVLYKKIPLLFLSDKKLDLLFMGCGQVVRRRNLSPPFKGSNPFTPDFYSLPSPIYGIEMR